MIKDQAIGAGIERLARRSLDLSCGHLRGSTPTAVNAIRVESIDLERADYFASLR